MILYHGSYLEISVPDLLHSRPNVDFGKGFYVTSIYEQAVKWCGKFRRRGKAGIISRYSFDKSRGADLKILKFDSYSEKWLKDRICRSVCEPRRRWNCCISKGVKWYESKSDFASEKI